MPFSPDSMRWNKHSSSPRTILSVRRKRRSIFCGDRTVWTEAMAGKFKLRHLMNRIPVLDRFRISFIANFFTYGIGSLDRNYDVIKVYPESIRPYVQGEKPAVFALYHGRMV